MVREERLVLMPKIESHVRFLVDNGLIFEINRKVLHPLGLALEVGIHPDNSKWVTIQGVSTVDDSDEEGFLYDEETYKVGAEKYKAFMDKVGNERVSLREGVLGYIIQEIVEKEEVDD